MQSKPTLFSLLSRLVDLLERYSSRPSLSFFGIFVLSIAVRLAILLSTNSGRIASSAEAERIAKSLAEDGTFANPYALPTGFTAHCAPFYPALLSLVYRLFGAELPGTYARCVLTILAYSVFFALLPMASRRLGLTTSVGVLAGFISAAFPFGRSAEVFYGWEEPYAGIALAFLLIATLALWRSEFADLLVWGAYGLGCGLALLISPGLVLVQVGLCLAHLRLVKNRWNVSRLWLISVVSAALILLPWTVRNHKRLGAWIFVRSNFGLELYLANNSAAAPTVEENLSNGWLRQAHPYMSQTAARQVLSLGEVQFNHVMFGKAIAWIRIHPKEFLNLSGRRLFYFWFGPFEYPLFALASTAISIFGWLGVARMRRRLSIAHYLLFLVPLLMFPLTYYFVQYTSRYRAPIRWILLVAASWYLIDLVKMRRARLDLSDER